MKYTKIAVYLSSKSELPESYVNATREVGKFLGSTGRTLVYGGCRRGLMEVLAQAAKQAGGRVYGVVPEIIEQRGLVSDAIDVTFRCVDLHDRKEVMERESEAFIVLPGGIGTLDEAFSVLANTTIGLARKPVIFYNVDGCWDALLAALDNLFNQNLISGSPTDYYAVATSIAQLEELL